MCVTHDCTGESGSQTDMSVYLQMAVEHPDNRVMVL